MDIIFTFSNLYENALKHDDKEPVLTWKKAEQKIKMLEEFWHTHGMKIVAELERITKLPFVIFPIPCYLSSVQSFSEPLTLKVYKKDEYTQDTLVHELCHVIMTQNRIGQTNAFKKLTVDFKEESPLTRVHILVHAIHQLVYEKLFPERLKSIQNFSEAPDYVRSWEIVSEIGAQKIVDTYLK